MTEIGPLFTEKTLFVNCLVTVLELELPLHDRNWPSFHRKDSVCEFFEQSIVHLAEPVLPSRRLDRLIPETQSPILRGRVLGFFPVRYIRKDSFLELGLEFTPRLIFIMVYHGL